MSGTAYAPVYKQIPRQRSTFYKQRRRVRTRSVNSSSDDDSDSSAHSRDAASQGPVKASVRHPVNRTDPFFVAGHPREDLLPPHPFPHAAVQATRERKPNVDHELAGLKPPILASNEWSTEQISSLKRRHLDNLTAILHSRILKQDWQRASRALGLILRTELLGSIDIRHHNRWALAGEILLHRDSETEPRDIGSVTEEGCKSAREFYEKMILHYPHIQQFQNKVNAATIYPALFNVWTFEVQHRSKQAMTLLVVDDERTMEDNYAYCAVRHKEYDEASEISSRMDHLMRGPPYDTDKSLLRSRGVIGQWIADICRDILSRATADSMSTAQVFSRPPTQLGSLELDALRQRAAEEDRVVKRLLGQA